MRVPLPNCRLLPLTAAAALLVSTPWANADERIWRVVLDDKAAINVLIGQQANTRARAALILLPGNDGRLRFDTTGQPTRLRNNFLVRTRHAMNEAGFITALLDAPSDRQKKPGLLAGYRATQRHAVRDIGTVVDLLKATFRVPVVVIGTSRGTVSAVNAARRIPAKKLAGLALTAAITRPNRRGATIQAVDINAITVPTLFVHHVNDKCSVTPLHGARAAFEAMQKAAVPVRWGMVTGGKDNPRPCIGRSHHGFWKSEGQALGHIKTWLAKVLAEKQK